eukprot:m.47166 g.47166  ORF g.47166 m.47166 type:complete len:484 (+) comp15565_c0_seq1:304-1755(+)
MPLSSEHQLLAIGIAVMVGVRIGVTWERGADGGSSGTDVAERCVQIGGGGAVAGTPQGASAESRAHRTLGEAGSLEGARGRRRHMITPTTPPITSTTATPSSTSTATHATTTIPSVDISTTAIASAFGTDRAATAVPGHGGEGSTATASPKDINLVLVCGRLPKPSTVGVTAEEAEEQRTSWEASRRRMRPRLSMYFSSLTKVVEQAANNLGGRPIRLYVVGNKAGREDAAAAIHSAQETAGERWPLASVKYIRLTSGRIKALIMPLTSSGLDAGFARRLWDFGKVVAMKVLPQSIKSALIIDVDVVFRQGFADIVEWHDTMRAANDDWLVAAPLELPQEGYTKPLTPWSMRNESTYVNSGVMLVNVDRIVRDRFLENLVPKALSAFTATEYYTRSDGNQWPPEQWVLNVALSATTTRFLPLPQGWVVDCTTPVGPWSHNQTDSDAEEFERLKKEAHIAHYCNNEAAFLLTEDEFRVVDVADQ